ncbi:uncharacterized protein BDW43DRAFT_307971 [Aspergillus alliaceus]|nr:uncharacterized protein BDW43DRAFT_307971 [Aspergillus alliaceus]KAB8236958.1 hypothetical protein BDW43DRAFT_307971 [Aspergillus alliaceus]
MNDSGLPQGYITHLEHRLAATEAALFTVYAQLRAGNHTQLPRQSPTYETAAAVSVDVVASSRGSRVESMAEWDALPLRGPGELERWWGVKRGVWGNDIENDGGGPSGFEREGGDGRDVLAENVTGDAKTDANLDLDSGKMSRAERLARSEPKVYF